MTTTLEDTGDTEQHDHHHHHLLLHHLHLLDVVQTEDLELRDEQEHMHHLQLLSQDMGRLMTHSALCDVRLIIGQPHDHQHQHRHHDHHHQERESEDGDDSGHSTRSGRDACHDRESIRHTSGDGHSGVIHAHRAVLAARCDYFRSLFECRMQESGQRDIHFPDKSLAHFRVLVDYFYTARINISHDNAFGVLKLSDELGVQSVKDRCVRYVMQNVSDDNVFDVLEEAHAFCGELRRYCTAYIERNAQRLFRGDPFLRIHKSTLVDLLRSDRINLPELDIFFAVLQWGKHQLRNGLADDMHMDGREQVGEHGDEAAAAAAAAAAAVSAVVEADKSASGVSGRADGAHDTALRRGGGTVDGSGSSSSDTLQTAQRRRRRHRSLFLMRQGTHADMHHTAPLPLKHTKPQAQISSMVGEDSGSASRTSGVDSIADDVDDLSTVLPLSVSEQPTEDHVTHVHNEEGDHADDADDHGESDDDDDDDDDDDSDEVREMVGRTGSNGDSGAGRHRHRHRQQQLRTAPIMPEASASASPPALLPTAAATAAVAQGTVPIGALQPGVTINAVGSITVAPPAAAVAAEPDSSNGSSTPATTTTTITAAAAAAAAIHDTPVHTTTTTTATEHEQLRQRFEHVVDYRNDSAFTATLRTFLSDVVPYVRFPLLSPDELLDFVEPSGMVPPPLLLEAYRCHALPNRTDLFDERATQRVKVREGSLFYGGGVLENVPITRLRGWTLAYLAPYSHATSEQVFASVPGTRILFAARHRNSGTLALCAMGRKERILQDTVENETTLENGVYWYHWRAHSIGFSDTPSIQLGSADVSPGRLRLSWHLTGRGGYRCGDIKGLNESDRFEKLIFYS